MGRGGCAVRGTHRRLFRAALSLRGFQAPWVSEGSLNGAAFEAYVQHGLAPSLRLGDRVVLDNLARHNHASIRRLLEARGSTVEFLLPCSPGFNPIELCWAKVKQALRAAQGAHLR